MEGIIRMLEKEIPMKKLLQVIVLTGLLSVFAVTAALAAPPPEKVDGFVCPVLGGQAGDGQGNSNPEVFIEIYDGDTSIVGPDVSVPVFATNDDGDGSPAGEHTSPGDAGYTAIWKK